MTEKNSTRVVITGLGLVSPLGSDLETVWANLSSGKSAIGPLENLHRDALPVRSGGQVKDFTGDIGDYGELDKGLQRSIKKNMKVMCREIEMGVAASQKALQHSGLGSDRNPDRCGCLFGCDYILTRPEEYRDGVVSCLQHGDGNFDAEDWPKFGLNKVNPLWLLKYLPNMPNSHVSIYNDFRGPNNSITVREASMNLSLAEAVSIIQRGAADVMLVGATGTRLHPLRTTVETLTEKLAEEREDPTEMSRPFDADSDGLVLGEGAAAVVLESLESAERRGAKLWGEIIGSGSAMVGPRKGSSRDYLHDAVRAALNMAMASAETRMPTNWHLHANGYGIPAADRSEGMAIANLLSGFQATPVVAAKSYFGNLGAGSAAVELICSLLALEHGQLFPIRNLTTPEDYVHWTPATYETSPGRAVVQSSFTLQGQASAIVVAAA